MQLHIRDIGISYVLILWFVAFLRTHCQSPKFLKSTVLEHDMAGWCSSWQTDWISRHPRTCDNVFSQQAKHGWNEWWNLKGEIIGSTRRMTKSQCQKVTEKAKSRDENLNPRLSKTPKKEHKWSDYCMCRFECGLVPVLKGSGIMQVPGVSLGSLVWVAGRWKLRENRRPLSLPNHQATS